MEPGDLIWVDFGIPIGSTAGFKRPAVIISSGLVLEAGPNVIVVTPLTSNINRSLRHEVPLDPELLEKPSAAQCHLSTAISTLQILETTNQRISATELAKIRSIIGDLLDIGG